MARSRHIGRRSRFPSSTKPASDLSAAASQALEAGGARRLWNESFFSAPQLKRDSLGVNNAIGMAKHRLLHLAVLASLAYASAAVGRCPARAAPIKTSVLVGSLLDSTSGERIRYGQAVLGSRTPVMTDTLG